MIAHPIRACFALLLIAASVQADDGGTKQPIPSAAEQTKAKKLIKDLFQADYEAARTYEDRQKLAATLLSKARESHGDPAGRYALLRVSLFVATSIGSVSDTLETLNVLDEHYKVDMMQERADALKTLADKATPDKYPKIFEQCDYLLQDLVIADRYDLAPSVTGTALRLARRIGDPSLARAVNFGQKRLKMLTTAYKAVSEADKTLNNDPTDPQANEIVGQYYCFRKGDWPLGLPLLALSGDQPLAKAAVAELKMPETPEAQLQLADAWWDLSASAKKQDQWAMQFRSAQWYQAAMPSLAGLMKVKAEKRLAEFGQEVPQIGTPLGQREKKVEIIGAVFGSGAASIGVTHQVRSFAADPNRTLWVSTPGFGVRNPRAYFRDKVVIRYRLDGIEKSLTIRNDARVNLYEMLREQ